MARQLGMIMMQAFSLRINHRNVYKAFNLWALYAEMCFNSR